MKTPASTPPQLLVPLPFVQALVNYLLRQPAGDVLPFISGLGDLARAQGLASVQPAPKDVPNA